MGTTVSPVAASMSITLEDVVVTSAPAIVSPRPAPKRLSMMSSFPLSKLRRLFNCYTLVSGCVSLYRAWSFVCFLTVGFDADSLVEAQVESGSSMPLTSREIVASTVGGQSVSLADLISQASVLPVGSSMPPSLFTTSVVMTPSPVTTPLFSSSAPASIFHSLIGDFPVSRKEMPTTSVGGESSSAKDTTVSDTRGSYGNFAEDGARLFDDLYLPTVCWDPHAQDKRYQPKWKIAESSRLVFPQWCLTGLSRLTLLLNLPMWRGRLESKLHDVGVRESRFLLEKNKVEDDLKQVTANLAEERIIWARDIAEKDRILSHAKAVQEELERKAINEARKVRSELSAEVEKFWVDIGFVYQVQERYQDLTIELKASNAKAQAKQVELE
ncbi:hypothetical protein Hanom_Chr06g00508641 [Helianthus anomalus]